MAAIYDIQTSDMITGGQVMCPCAECTEERADSWAISQRLSRLEPWQYVRATCPDCGHINCATMWRSWEGNRYEVAAGERMGNRSWSEDRIEAILCPRCIPPTENRSALRGA